MVVDGVQLANSLLDTAKTQHAQLVAPARLTIVTASPNFETQKYLDLKKRKAAQVGIRTNIIELPAEATTEEVVCVVDQAVKNSHAIVVQLPLPQGVDTEKVVKGIPATHDADGLRYGAQMHSLPPVVGAIAYLSKAHNVSWLGQTVVVVGRGRLVGGPVAEWAQSLGATVTVLDETTADEVKETALRSADIIVSGAGVPRLITLDMVKEGVVLFDGGTSEDGGTLAGDVDPVCAAKARLMTPVPGGIGPLTIACLLQNVVTLAAKQQNVSGFTNANML